MPRPLHVRSTHHGPGFVSVLLLAVVFALTSPTGRAADLKTAERALLLGRVDEAVNALHAATAANPKDAAAHLLLCRAFYSEELAGPAVTECEAALANGLAGNSAAQDWMGRAYGRKADGAGPFAGLSLAKKVKTAFERAVELDPANASAVNDLSEYYVGAPSIVGGGLDKATALADRVQARLPQPAHRIRALAAEKNKDYATAETEFRAATAVANRVNAWVDLADFYSRRKQAEPALDAIRHALTGDTGRDASLVDIASILEHMRRELPTAQRILREYLASPAQTDAAPAFAVHVQLGRLLANAGDKPAAQAEYRAALALASQYAPARKALAQ